jgi:hypothetical protein
MCKFAYKKTEDNDASLNLIFWPQPYGLKPNEVFIFCFANYDYYFLGILFLGSLESEITWAFQMKTMKIVTSKGNLDQRFSTHFLPQLGSGPALKFIHFDQYFMPASEK